MLSCSLPVRSQRRDACPVSRSGRVRTPWLALCDTSARWLSPSFQGGIMSRTRNRKSYRSWWNKQKADIRRVSLRQYRARCRKLIREERYDEIQLYRRTQGWLTW